MFLPRTPATPRHQASPPSFPLPDPGTPRAPIPTPCSLRQLPLPHPLADALLDAHGVAQTVGIAVVKYRGAQTVGIAVDERNR